MRKKYISLNQLIITCFLLGHFSVLAQSDGVEVPDGFGINQLQTTENLSSGVLNINLPIESFLVPVSISYNTSGIRVSQRAGVVGLGWNLNAGGFITRQTRGLPDDIHNGYSGLSERGQDVAVTTSDAVFYAQAVEADQNSKWDPHPDIYFFQFLGHSGQFTMDHDRSIIKLTPNHLKIIPNYNFTSGASFLIGFKVIDENGNEYYFDNTESTRVFNDEEEVQSSYRSKWHLTQMVDYATGDAINFQYSAAPVFSEYTRLDWKRPGESPFEGSTTVKSEVTWPLLIAQISYKNLLITFSYSDRNDHALLKKLDEIKYHVDGDEKINYNFAYDYLGEGTASRLMLKEVSKSSLDLKLYQFAYFGQSKYESTLPAYDSDQQDHWGYYNSNSAAHRFDGLGANLSPNLGRTRANALKKIYHTGGGFEEFEYELNNYYNGSFHENIGGLRIKKIHKGDFDGNNYVYKSYDYTNDAGNSSGELFAEPLHAVTMSNNGNDFLQYREQSYEPLQDHMGRHIVYENVTVSLLGGGHIKNTFATFQDDNTLGTNINQNLRVSQWSGITETPGTYNSSHPGPFGYKSFKGSATGLLERREVVDFSGNKVALEEYFYTTVPAGNTISGMNTGLFGFGSGDYWYNVDFYELGDGYMQLNQMKSTQYDVSNENKKLTTVTEYGYHSNYQLPKFTKTYLLGDDPSDIRQETIEYLFEQPGALTGLETSNLLALVKSKTQKKGTRTLGSQTTEYSLNNSGKVVPNKALTYRHGLVDTELVNDQSFVYDDTTNKLVGLTNNLTGTPSAQLWNSDGTNIIAEVGYADPEDCAFTSFEGGDVSGWTVLMPASSTSGIIGQACHLTLSNISKNIKANKEYLISYWYKSGGVNLSGLSSNQLIHTKNVDGWTFEERLISRSTDGDLAIAGSGFLDHLSLYPKEARMRSYTYHDLFGKTSETNANNNTIHYEYDEAGRVKTIKDKNLDIVSAKEYQITQFIHASVPTVSSSYGGGSVEILVESNGPWQITKSSWIDVTPATGNGVTKIIATIHNNSAHSIRHGSITISETGSTGVPSYGIGVSQGAAPSDYVVVSPGGIAIDSNPVTVSVFSNKSWTASITHDSGNRINILGSSSGSGDGSLQVSAINIDGVPQTGAITITASDGTASAVLNITY